MRTALLSYGQEILPICQGRRTLWKCGGNCGRIPSSLRGNPCGKLSEPHCWHWHCLALPMRVTCRSPRPIRRLRRRLQTLHKRRLMDTSQIISLPRARLRILCWAYCKACCRCSNSRQTSWIWAAVNQIIGGSVLVCLMRASGCRDVRRGDTCGTRLATCKFLSKRFLGQEIFRWRSRGRSLHCASLVGVRGVAEAAWGVLLEGELSPLKVWRVRFEEGRGVGSWRRRSFSCKPVGCAKVGARLPASIFVRGRLLGTIDREGHSPHKQR